MAWTNRGKLRAFEILFRSATAPTSFYVALVTNDVPPTASTTVFSALTEITPDSGGGYVSGGAQITRGDGTSGVGFDVMTEAATTLTQIEDIVWTAAGSSLPLSGNGARWAVLLDANGTVGSREVWMYWDLVSDRTVSIGQPLTLVDTQITIS